MKILAIGNSFSEDACRYIHKIAAADGQTVKTVNLYIGGCPLQTHYYNILENNAAYDFQFNGESTRLKVNIKQVLMSDDWDAVTFQQVSQAAPHFATYEPYLSALADYVRTYLPHTKFYMHQTWAYEAGSERLKNAGFDTPQEMLEHIRSAYQAAADRIGACGIIPSGDAMFKALENGMEIVHRDTFHASLGFGRYLLGLVWYGFFTGRSVKHIPFDAFDVPVSDKEREIAARTAAAVLGTTL